jgi:hypothetical protein
MTSNTLSRRYERMVHQTFQIKKSGNFLTDSRMLIYLLDLMYTIVVNKLIFILIDATLSEKAVFCHEPW